MKIKLSQIKNLIGVGLVLLFAAGRAVSAAETLSCRSLILQLETKTYKTVQGNFSKVSQKQELELADYYRNSLKSENAKTFKASEVQRVTRKDLTIDLDVLSVEELNLYRTSARKNLKELYYFTSGAGLWSRGGGQVKALIPYNIGDFLSASERTTLVELINIAKADSAQKVLDLAQVPRDLHKTETEQAADLVKIAKTHVEKIVSNVRKNPRALTVLDMKFVNVAVLSHQGKTFIPFDIWTSQQTHKPIFDYIQNLRQNYKQKVFHQNPNINSRIHQYLSEYFKKADEIGETHIFGYQEGFHGVDPMTGLPVPSTATIGEGAGMAKAYLDKSGRTDELKKMGKNYLLFDNIEVISEIDLVLGAHLQSHKAVSVLLVPQRDGYAGGNPFIFSKPWGKNLELYEMSALPTEFANGNEYFNSNTLIYSLQQKPVRILGFEAKTENGVKFMRVKNNAADITQTQPTAGIGGRIGIDYVNFKSISEFFENGEQLIKAYQNIWSEFIEGRASEYSEAG